MHGWILDRRASFRCCYVISLIFPSYIFCFLPTFLLCSTKTSVLNVSQIIRKEGGTPWSLVQFVGGQILIEHIISRYLSADILFVVVVGVIVLDLDGHVEQAHVIFFDMGDSWFGTYVPVTKFFDWNLFEFAFGDENRIICKLDGYKISWAGDCCVFAWHCFISSPFSFVVKME